MKGTERTLSGDNLRCWLKTTQYSGSLGIPDAVRGEFLLSGAVTGTKGISI
jgi:hypothetical protein